jgi:SPP1 gp7 family putative phage head morphogenesis protein
MEILGEMKFRAFDAVKKKTLKGKFKPSANAERQFYAALRKVALVSGHIIDQGTYGHNNGVGFQLDPDVQKSLEAYAKKLGPWAERQSAKLLDQVQRSNKAAYRAKSKAIGQAIQLEAADSHIGIIAAALMEEQVELIKSIPIEAGRRAQKIALEAVLTGTRAAPDNDTINELKKQLGLSTEVAVSRAQLIARTETARASAAINQARAMSVGSGQYRWHNSGDGAVRHSHKVYKGRPMQGRIFSWDEPPTLSDGMKGHPGTFPNCRCFAEPVFSIE